MKRPNKYHAVPTIILHKGREVRCASKMEATELAKLVLRERIGEITGLTFHPRYRLYAWTPGVVDLNGRLTLDIQYEADATFFENDKTVVFEVKGHDTALWRLKEKLFRANYPNTELRVVRSERGLTRAVRALGAGGPQPRGTTSASAQREASTK